MDQRIQRDNENSDLGCGQQEIREWLCPDDCRALRADMSDLKWNCLPASPHTPPHSQYECSAGVFWFLFFQGVVAIPVNFRAR